MAAPLGVREQDAVPPMRLLTDYLGERALLLIVDNCEHLIPAAAIPADALLRSCRGCGSSPRAGSRWAFPESYQEIMEIAEPRRESL